MWKTLYSDRSADGKEVKVQEAACFADCAVRVVAIADGQSTPIIHASQCVVNFAHAIWIGPVVGIFVDGGTCGPIRVAYDTSSGRSVPFTNVERALAESIIRAYAVTPAELKSAGGDVFVWATYPQNGKPRRSMDEFRKRHGG